MNLLVLLFSLVALRAQTIPLQMLNSDQFDAIAHELSAASAFSSVSGAGTLGRIFGFEVGVMAGVTNTPALQRIARDADPKANVKQVPTAAVTGMISVPLGLTIEAGLLPRVGGQDFKIESLGLAVKWTPTQVFFDLPLDLGVRVQTARTSLQFNARVQDVITRADFDGRVTGFELIASKNMGILTPFAAVGGLAATADLNASGAAVFDPAFAANQSARTKPRGALYRAGLEIHLLVLSLSVEYQRALDADRFDAKLAAGF